MNKRILVPTDFSDNAWVAIRYAVNLAIDKKKSLTILHTFFPFYSSFTSMEHNVAMFEEAEKVAEAEMDLIRKVLDENYPDLDYECLCLEGGLSEVITKENKDEDFGMIVMGTKGASGLQYTIMGSNTFDVINKTNIPVLAVPDKTVYKLNKVGVLTNYKRSDVTVLNKLTNIIGYDFSTALLHVREDADGLEQAYAEAWRDVVKEETKLQEVSVSIRKGERVQVVVNEMMAEEEVDLLLVTNNAKSFIRNLFSRNLVKALALKPQIPILFVKVA